MTILWPPFVGWMFFCSLLFRILSRTRVIRSAATNCPITVFTDGYLLTLKNASPDRDMTIRITDMAKGGVVYENDIPEVQSAYITISIANFPAEEYKLEITGTPSGHLTGYFTKE